MTDNLGQYYLFPAWANLFIQLGVGVMSMGVEDKVFLLHSAQAVGIHSYVLDSHVLYQIP